jgi:hypothetical protein
MACRVWRLDALVQKPPSISRRAFERTWLPFFGGCAWETLGSAGLPWPGSPTRVQLPPYCLATIEW